MCKEIVGLLLLVAGLGLASPVDAQRLTFGSIEGTVTDDSGAVLPGVSLTLTSPVLQVPQQINVTDAEGRYRFPDLQVGVYRVQAELSGFQTYVRENLQIDTGFVARVDISLKVGSLTETVTVSGVSPVVDLTTTRGGQTISTQVVARTLPMFGHTADVVRLTPGLEAAKEITATAMGGGNTGGNLSISAYGQESSTVMIEDFQLHTNNQPALFGGSEQMDVKTFGNTAEVQNPGVALNYVMSSGGNQFHGKMSTFLMGNRLAGDNIDDNLRAQGFTLPEKVNSYYDVNGYVSGRLIRDKLWFFAGARKRESKRTIGGFVFDPGPDGQYLTSDEPAAEPKAFQRGAVVKLSNQMTPKYQIVGFFWYDSTFDEGRVGGIFGGSTPRLVPWRSSTNYEIPDYYWNGQFRGAPRNNFTFDLKGGLAWFETRYTPKEGYDDLEPHTYDRTTQLYGGSSISDGVVTAAKRVGTNMFWQGIGSATYIPTGGVFNSDHQIKFGFRTLYSNNKGRSPNHPSGNYALLYDTVSGLPHQPAELTTLSLPVSIRNDLLINSLYVTDQWRVSRRLSINVGLRFDRQHPWVPPQKQEAGQFVQAASFPRVEFEVFNNWAPRAAAAWDLTGNGKTAVKASYGWFTNELNFIGTSGFTGMWNPVAPTRTTYRWSDPNGNGRYDPGEVNLDVSGTNPAFLGITSPANTRPLSKDFRAPHAHEFAASVEHEIMPGMAGRLLYVYKKSVDDYVTVNAGRPYSVFNIPLTRRDPGPDGNINTPDDGPMVTIYDYDAAYRGAPFVINERVNRPGDRSDVAQTIEGSLNKRLANRWSLLTSFGATRQHRWLTPVPQSPNDEAYPLDETWTRILRVSGSYEMPYGVQLGGTLRVSDGIAGQRTYVFRAADPLGGTPLRQLTTVTLRLEPFGATRGKIQETLDFRASKSLKLRGTTDLELSVDFLNALNSNAAQALTLVSGPTYGNIDQIPTPRAVRFGAQYSF